MLSELSRGSIKPYFLINASSFEPQNRPGKQEDFLTHVSPTYSLKQFGYQLGAAGEGSGDDADF